MIFPAICDVIRNLSGMWQLLFPEKWACYLDLPQNFRPEVGGRFYRLELERMARELTARGAKALTEESMRTAVRDENQRRRLLEKVRAWRRAEPWRVPASEAWLLARAGGALPAREHAALIGDYLAAVALRTGAPKDNVRVVLVGSFCEQPPLPLMRTLESAGCDIVDDDLQLGFHLIDGDLSEQGDPLQALVDGFLFQGRPCASRYIAEEEKGRALLDQVQACEADGVIFCAPLLLRSGAARPAHAGDGLRARQVPWTSFKYAENTGQFQVIREQAGTFSDSIKLWEAVS